MKKFINEFKTFALRGNMMDMAIGIIIGSAFSDIVSSLTHNFINPILNFVTGVQSYTFQEMIGFLSAFLSSLIHFLIMAFVLFCLLKLVNRLMSIGKKETSQEPQTKICPYCQSEISIKALRCPHCTSQLNMKKD